MFKAIAIILAILSLICGGGTGKKPEMMKGMTVQAASCGISEAAVRAPKECGIGTAATRVPGDGQGQGIGDAAVRTPGK